jgi:LacI family transcriptional regulator
MPHSRATVGIRLPVWAGSTTPVMRGVARYMRNHRHWRIETLNDSYGEMENIEISIGWQGDGLILYRATEQELADFKKRGIAVVLLSTEGPDAGYPRVLPDNAAAGRAAAKHLMGIGHDSFAYLARGETLYKEDEFISGQRVYSRERLAGYKAALAENDFQPRVHMLPGFPLWKKNTWKKVERAVEGFLTELPSPTGMFVVDDALASVVLRVAGRTDIAVPQSLSVLGFGDDVNYCHASLPTLSSIPYPAQAVGYRAAKELARQLAGEGTGDRGTTGKRYVSLWIRYIAASRPISLPSTMLKRRCSSAGSGGPRRAPQSALRTFSSRRHIPTAP